MAVVQVGGVWPGATLLLLLSNILPLLLLAPYTQAGPDGEDSAFDKVFPPFYFVFYQDLVHFMLAPLGCKHEKILE
jgi:hypothetical protein